MSTKLLERIVTYKQRPDIAKALTVEELTTAFADLFAIVRATNEAIEAGKVKGADGYTPKADVDFMSMVTARAMLGDMLSSSSGKVDSAVQDGLDRIDAKLKEIRNGEDAIITDEHLDEAARRASLLVDMPDFTSLITAEPEAIRNALELLRGDKRISIKAVDGWEDEIKQVREEIQNIAITKGSGGGLGRRQVIDLINANAGSGSVSDEVYGAGWDGVTDEAASKNAIYDKIETLAGGHDPVTVTDTAEIELTLTDQDIQASIKTGSVDVLKLDAGVQTSLGKADTASQPGHTHTASEVTDFDTEVANNSAVTANTAKLTADTTNVAAAGALMDSEVTNLAQVKAFDSADYATAAQGATANSAMQDLVDDTSPTLGGELDCGANSIGFTMQTATGDGTTTVDWGNGNHMDFTFGAFNETFTFTAPAKPGVYTMSLKQDSVGSRTATWPGTVKWPAGTAPTLTTTATTGYDIVAFRFDGTNYYGTSTLNFS